MIARKRERETLEALQDVVRYLSGVREERKAVVTVTAWLGPLHAETESSRTAPAATVPSRESIPSASGRTAR